MLETINQGLVHGRFRPQSILHLGLTAGILGLSFAFARDLDLGRAVFLLAFFILSAAPYFLLAHDPRYRLMAFFMLVYFAMFGLMDYILLFTDQAYRIYTSSAFIPRTSLTDVVILTGGGCFWVCYLLASTLCRRHRMFHEPPAWKYSVSVWFALTCWLIGIAAQFIVQFVYWTTGPEQVGVASHAISNLFYLALLGGIIMIVTALNHSGTLVARTLLCFMMIVELAFGFFGNTKEVSFRLGILTLITLYFLHGRISLALILVLVLLFIPYQAVFKVYREHVIQVRKQSALEAIQDMDRSIETVAKGTQHEKGAAIKAAFMLLDRIDGRKYVEIITQQTGTRVPYLRGQTVSLYFYAFVPRMLWPDKPQISTGQLMNRTFRLSASPLTFVPSTQLGEFYWNFGISGVVLGMSFIGMLLAMINGIFLSGARASTVGMLVILVAFYFLVMRFESGFASQYNQFTRVVLLIGLMAFVFNRLGWTERRRTNECPEPGVNNGATKEARNERKQQTRPPFQLLRCPITIHKGR